MPQARLARAIAIALLLTAAGFGAARAEPDLVVLVRHAERAAEPAGDPALTPAGEARAKALAHTLAHAGVSHIVTTQYQRTKATAAPLAAARGITPMVVEAKRGMDHATAVAAVVKQLSGVVLVVGHGNTVPAIAAQLMGGAKQADFCESSYSHLWLVQGPKLVRARYGEADLVEPAAGCQ